MSLPPEILNTQREQKSFNRRQFFSKPVSELTQRLAALDIQGSGVEQTGRSATVDVFTRRQVHRLSLQTLAMVSLLAACGTTNVDFRALYEKGEIHPDEGQVFSYGNQHVIVRGSKTHLIEDIEAYKRGVLFDAHGRVIRKDLPSGGFGQPIIHREGYVEISATKEVKDPSRNRIMPIYVTGILDTKSLRNPDELSDKTVAKVIEDQKRGEKENGNTVIDATGTFIDLMTRLNKRGISYENSLRLMYGKMGQNSYSTLDTLSDPGQHIKDMGAQMDEYVNKFPLSQFVMIGYSLGGLYALMAAMQHPDAVNDIVLIESPIMGFPRKDPEVIAAKQLLHDITGGASDKVIDYLCDLYENKDYQNTVYDFAADFTKDDKKTITYITVDADGFVPRKYAYIPGRGNGKQNLGREMRFRDIKINGGIIGSHGPGLWQPKALDFQESLFGFDPATGAYLY